jgi:hypothetical protein
MKEVLCLSYSFKKQSAARWPLRYVGVELRDNRIVRKGPRSMNYGYVTAWTEEP